MRYYDWPAKAYFCVGFVVIMNKWIGTTLLITLYFNFSVPETIEFTMQRILSNDRGIKGYIKKLDKQL